MTEETVLPLSSRPVSGIALVGFMGAGKTTVGQALAARLGWAFTDLDRLIERRDGRTIEQIFQLAGEPVFRQIEQESLREALESLQERPSVLALGGGATTRGENRHLLASTEIAIVFLDAPVEELFRRCEQPGVVRPLRRDLNRFRELYEARRASYGNSTLKIFTGGRDIPSIVEEIISGLKLVPISGASE
ncbi:MAG TPA: shikimate kinase [Terriglobales bacterium]|jgi:shikimate kinase|nr:shikimate kinase [Terriglobales bacterium]